MARGGKGEAEEGHFGSENSAPGQCFAVDLEERLFGEDEELATVRGEGGGANNAGEGEGGGGLSGDHCRMSHTGQNVPYRIGRVSAIRGL